MKTLLVALICLLVVTSAHAQSTASQSIPGYLTNSGCPGGAPVCFKQYGPSIPTVPGTSSPLAYSPTITATVGTTSGSLVAAGTYTNSLQVCTLPGSTTNVWLNPNGGTAVVNEGAYVPKGGGCFAFSPGIFPLPSAVTAITAITDGGSPQNVALVGG